MIFSVVGVLLASAFVFVTTADDTVWLIPVIATPRHTVSSRSLHCAIFVIGLQFACFISWCLCVTFGKVAASIHVRSIFGNISVERTVQIIGALICWLITIILGYKKVCKWCRITNPRENSSPRKTATEMSPLVTPPENAGSASLQRLNSPTNVCYLNSSTSTEQEQEGARPWFVLTMTLAGAADEIMCFPGLMLAGTFSYAELAIGCLVASLALLGILLSMYATFKPVFDMFDRIPLFVVVGMFAVIQTVDLIIS